MPRVVLALALLVGLLAFVGCVGPSQRDLLRALEAAGCRGAPASEYQELGDRVVLSVSVRECVDPTTGRDRGIALVRSDAFATMSDAIWSTATYRFDGLFVTVYRTGENPQRPRAQSAEFSREQLVARFGPRDPALDHAPALVSLDDMAWRVIPMLAAAATLLLLQGLWLAIRDGCITPIWIIGRSR